MLEAQGYIAISVIYLVVAWVHWRFSNKLTLRPANRRQTNRMSKEPENE